MSLQHYIKRFVLLCTVLFMAVGLSACAFKHRPVQNMTYEIPSNLNKEQILQGIKRGLSLSDFSISSSGDALRAEGPQNSRRVVIEISYDLTSFTVSPIEAEGYNYDKTEGTIHSAYYRRIKVVTDNINNELRKLSLGL